MRALMPFAAMLLLGAAAPPPVDMPHVNMEMRVLPQAAAPGNDIKGFVKAAAGSVALTHVRVIDGTGAAAMTDRTLLIQSGRIAGVQAGSGAVPAGYQVIDAAGKSVMPGLVGMHDHMYYIAR